MEMAGIAGNQVLIMFLLMGAGYFLYRKKLITEQGATDLNKLLIMLISPCLIIAAYNRPFEKALFEQLLYGFFLAAISHAIAILLSLVLLRGKKDTNKIEQFALIFSNSGFMGFPLISAMLGAEGIIFASAYLIVFTFTQWTVGVLLLTGKTDAKTMLRKLLFNPGILSLLIGLSIFCFSIPLPGPISSAVGFLSDLNTPVAMLLIGTFVARSQIWKSFTNLRVYYVSALRLLAVPLLMIPFYLLLKAPQDLMIANFVATACPVAALAAMFPSLYGYDAKYASGFITVSTLLSVATIPLMVMLLSYLTGF